MPNYTADQIISQIEKLRQGELNQDEQDSIWLWTKGRMLAQIVGYPGWECVLEILQSYVTDATRNLLTTDPGKRDDVIASQAVAYAANRIHNNFITDVKNMVELASKTPEVVKDGFRSNVPVESL